MSIAIVSCGKEVVTGVRCQWREVVVDLQDSVGLSRFPSVSGRCAGGEFVK